jgi:predicted  nucleic acid-binding Zn-ribbon protein
VSDPARPDTPAARAFSELEQHVRHLGEELSTFRKRAQAAEQRLKALGAPSTGSATAEERVAALEAENAKLRERLGEAGNRTRAMLDRVRFLRQQHVIGGEA